MELTPFTLEEAEEIREDFEDLVDTDFKIGNSPEMLVENVVIAPFAPEDKETFLAHYSAIRDTASSLESYTGAEFDVILITSEADGQEDYSHIDIRTFAELRGIKYSFPGS